MPTVRLFEISAIVTYTAVIAAVSEQDALDHISSWEQSWPSHSDFGGISDIEVIDRRDLVTDDADDEAHSVTSAARLCHEVNQEPRHETPLPEAQL